MSSTAIVGLTFCLTLLVAVTHASTPNGSTPYPRAWASSLETPTLRADLVADGNPETRWSSAFADNQWIVIDLLEPREIRTLTIVWNTAAAKKYAVMTSLDGGAYTRAAIREGTAKEGPEEIELSKPVKARYIRLDLEERSTQWGFSIHEIRINGESPASEDLPTPPENARYRDASAPPAERARDVITRMSFREKVRMLGGTGMFYFPGNERLGLDTLFMADASMGLRIEHSTAFPAFVSLAASFNPELARRYGDAVGEECRAKGVHVLLGPGVNLYRVPQGGRNFEYLGEDPYLASRMVVPYIKGVQDRGVIATVKHFVANNHEWHRKVSNSVVDERTLRELYFRAFRAAVQDAGVGAVMTSYNLVNGEYASENPWLVKHVLQEEWGFEGIVMTDWWSSWDALKVIKSGVSLEMPSGVTLDEPTIRALIDADLVSEQEIDTMLTHTLATFFRFGFYDRPQTDPDAVGFGGPHNEVALDTARQGIVLLRNEGSFLPLSRADAPSVVLIGKNARETETSGHGAARVEPTDPVSIQQAFEASGKGRARIQQFDTITPREARAVRDADAVFVSVVTSEREANDRAFGLDKQQLDLIASATRLSDNVCVLVTSGSGIEMAPWIGDTRAVIQAWYGGNVGATALGEIVFGDVNPSGKMPFSLEKSWEDAAAYGNFLPHDASFNDQPIWGRERPVFPVVYNEGVMLGYRHFDEAGIEPLFPFGFGLSYTTFSFHDLRIDAHPSGDDVVARVSFTLENTGKAKGSEVAQVYASFEAGGLPQPPRQLVAFERVELEPGESKRITLDIRQRELSYFNPEAGRWEPATGEVGISVGSSSRDIPLTGSFEAARN